MRQGQDCRSAASADGVDEACAVSRQVAGDEISNSQPKAVRPVEASSYEQPFGIAAGSDVVVPTLPVQQEQEKTRHQRATGYDEYFGGNVSAQNNDSARNG